MYIENATGQAIAAAIGDINLDTSGLAKDSTLQAVNSTLEEIKTAIDNLSFNDLFIIRTYTASWSWSSGSKYITLTANDFNITTPDGYTPISILRMSTGGSFTALRFININALGTTNCFGFNYEATASATATATLVIAYVKTGSIQ